jgi:hypothetical protein
MMTLAMTDIYLCERCAAHLWGKGKMYLDIWKISCKSHCSGFLSIQDPLDDKMQEIIERLEEEHYIITTEMNNDIVIKPRGHYYLGNNRHGFCINMREHRTIFKVD